MFLEEDQGTKEVGVVIQFLPGAVSIGEQIYNYSSSSEEGEMMKGMEEIEGEREEKVVIPNNETCSVAEAHIHVSSEKGSSELSQSSDLKPEEEDSEAYLVSLKLESLSIGRPEPGTGYEISSSGSDTHTIQSYTHTSHSDSHTSQFDTHATQSDAHASQSDTLTDTFTCSTQSQTATVANSGSHNTDSGINSATMPQINIQHCTPKKSVEVGVFDRSHQQPSAISTPLNHGSRPVSRLSSTASVFEGIFTSSAKHKDGSLIPIVFQVLIIARVYNI